MLVWNSKEARRKVIIFKISLRLSSIVSFLSSELGLLPISTVEVSRLPDTSSSSGGLWPFAASATVEGSCLALDNLTVRKAFLQHFVLVGKHLLVVRFMVFRKRLINASGSGSSVSQLRELYLRNQSGTFQTQKSTIQ